METPVAPTFTSLESLRQNLQQWRRCIIELTKLSTAPIYANNAAAIAGGLQVGDFYRTGTDPDLLCVVH